MLRGLRASRFGRIASGFAVCVDVSAVRSYKSDGLQVGCRHLAEHKEQIICDAIPTTQMDRMHKNQRGLLRIADAKVSYAWLVRDRRRERRTASITRRAERVAGELSTSRLASRARGLAVGEGGLESQVLQQFELRTEADASRQSFPAAGCR